mmetsp:Transcript_22541/g.40692  ORF Transcript_22541/g.40692 Transcript_22541/m.40692 type:complete len:125 (+) Transcript_22541:2-376(+)
MMARRAPGIQKGNLAVVLLISSTMWSDPNAGALALPEHYVVISDFEYHLQEGKEEIRIVLFSAGELQEKVLTVEQYCKIVFEAITVEFSEFSEAPGLETMHLPALLTSRARREEEKEGSPGSDP